MPRIYASNNDPIDLCQKHYPATELLAFKRYGHRGDGPDDRGNCFGYDAAHPDYEDEDYRCYRCAKRLTREDD